MNKAEITQKIIDYSDLDSMLIPFEEIEDTILNGIGIKRFLGVIIKHGKHLSIYLDVTNFGENNELASDINGTDYDLLDKIETEINDKIINGNIIKATVIEVNHKRKYAEITVYRKVNGDLVKQDWFIYQNNASLIKFEQIMS